MKNLKTKTTSSSINTAVIQRLLILLTVFLVFPANTLNAQVINNKTKKQLEKQQKEKLFGGNKPLTSPDGRSPLPERTYHLTAKLEILDERGSRVLREVEKGQHVVVRLTVNNTGLAPSPRFKIISRRYGEVNPINGLAQGESYRKDFRDVVAEDHMSGDYSSWFTGGYTLRSTDDKDLPVTRAESGGNGDLMMPVRGFELLSMYEGGISDVRLTTSSFPLDSDTRKSMQGHLRTGITETISGKVTIFNHGNVASKVRNMSMTLESTGEATAPSSNRSLIRTGRSFGARRSNGSGTLDKTISIPVIPAHGQITMDFAFQNVLYELYELHTGGLHIPEALGAYACGRNPLKVQWRGSSFRITAVLQTQANHSVRTETKVATGRFATDVGYGNCGVENFSQH